MQMTFETAERLKKAGNKLMIIIFTVIAVIIVLLFLASWFFAGITMTGKRQTVNEAMQWQSSHYDTSFYDNLEKTDYTAAGFNDYVLHVQLLRNPIPSTRYVIISHGYTDNRIGSLKYARMYLDLGFNCLIYDLRGHGDNEAAFTTYGLLESRDLICLINDTADRYPDCEQLGLHGESLGAATTVTALKYNPQVDFVVADCGFSDIENVLRNGYRNAHLPPQLFDLTDLGVRIRCHCSLREMRPIDSLDENKIPVLFIHGTEDTFIMPHNSKAMFERTKGIRDLFLAENAGHAESVLKDPDQYIAAVEHFLNSLTP